MHGVDMVGARQGQVLVADQRLPLVVQPLDGPADLGDFARTHASTITARLLEHGAILFRGFGSHDVAQFEAFANAVSSARLDYVYRSTPRTDLGCRIFTATEYPSKYSIPLHNENAYQRDWPMRVAFCCLIPASSGGETPLADMRRVTQRIGRELLGKFQSLGVRYLRNYRRNVDIPWQTVFQTEEPSAVADYCAAHGIDHDWIDQDTLRTSQVSQGVAEHPMTGETVFFNQAHLFHVSSLGPQTANSLLDLYGKAGLPRHACYGDGSEIGLSELEIIRAAFEKEAIRFPWRSGDVLLLDNMQVAHGRQPFTGDRRVVAALLDPWSQQRSMERY